MDAGRLRAMTRPLPLRALQIFAALAITLLAPQRSAWSAQESIRVLGHDAHPSFADEFETLSLDLTGTGKGWLPWFLHFNVRTLKGNNERELYVDELFLRTQGLPATLDPFALSEGTLVITARRVPDQSLRKLPSPNLRFASGMLSSERSFVQRYGYFEIRARLPAVRGTWPAFWLLPKSGAWPPEIDVFEVIGQEPKRIHQNAIRADKSSTHTFVDIAPDAASWHTYGLLWTQTEIVWLVDGHATKRAPNVSHEPMYLIVNLAIGGRWPGEPPDDQPFSASMVVDYVRAYSLEPRHRDALSAR
jgi:beta-glucanase (GH16 family)